MSIFTDLFLAVLAAITLEGVASWAGSKRAVPQRFAASALIVGVGALTAITQLVAGFAPFSGFQAVAAPGVLTHLTQSADGQRQPPEALVFPAASPFSGTPLAWQALADYSYRDYEGYAWYPQAGRRAAATIGPPGLCTYLIAWAPVCRHPWCSRLGRETEIRTAFARGHVDLAVVVDGYPGSGQLRNIYDQTFSPGDRVAGGEVWRATSAGGRETE